MDPVAAWLEWARGPVFRFAVLVLILGLARRFVLSVVGVARAMRVAGVPRVPWRAIFLATLASLLPVRKMLNRPFYSLASVVFHICFVAVALFFCAHVILWRRGIGFGWWSFDYRVADILTIVAVLAIVLLFLGRACTREGRRLSTGQDYFYLVLMVLPLLSGYLAAHPAVNPVSYNLMMFIHVMSGNLLMILVPFTRLSHFVLLPTAQLVSELGWHFVPGAGQKVAVALGKENEPI